MTKQQLLAYIPMLRRLAQSRCRDLHDADDLVSETLLAALSYLHRGGEIAYPQTWLTHTLMHKFNDALRAKYRLPTVTYESMPDEGEEDGYTVLAADEAAEVRRETAYLSAVYRDVLIRFYFRGQPVAQIASELGIPEGTVKSRLSTGRQQMKRRMDMENEKSVMPMTLHLANSGSQGKNHEPVSLAEGDLIAQNLLIHAYDRPLAAEEIARRIGIPTVYIEPILEKLTDAELMIKTDGGRYATDFIIYKPEDTAARLQPQLQFVREHFDAVWPVMETMLTAVRAMPATAEMPAHVRIKLERYALLEALQQFELYKNGVPKDFRFAHKQRPDGGAWTAFGYAYPMGYSTAAHREAEKYTVCGGRRTSGGSCDFEGASYLRLYEFDTNLWDSPHRFAACGFDTYFESIRALLWCAYRGIEPETPFPDAMLEAIPRLCELGMLTKENGRLHPAVPVLERESFGRFTEIVSEATESLDAAIGADFRRFLAGQTLAVPAHLSHVEMPYRLKCATQCFVMGVVRQAYERGLHLAEVDYCCPPVVLEYRLK